MASPEKKSIASTIKEIEDAAKDKGTITDREFFDITDGSAAEDERFEKIYETLEKLGIKIIETDVGEALSDESLEDVGCDDNGDLVKTYLKEISKIGPLTSEQEKELAKRIKNGDFAAKKQLAEAKLRLVVGIAKRYVGTGMPFIDIIQEGNIGLLRAAERYEYDKSYSFSTYAVWLIRQCITEAISDLDRRVTIHGNMIETINKVKRASAQLLHENGRDATAEEIAEEADIPVEQVIYILQTEFIPLRLDEPIGETGDSRLGDLIPDEDSPTPENA